MGVIRTDRGPPLVSPCDPVIRLVNGDGSVKRMGGKLLAASSNSCPMALGV